jgi:hypothetical protein
MLSDWIMLLLFGGIVGAMGQGIRAVVGLKKTYDEAATLNASVMEVFRAARLVVSLLVGFIAGALGALMLVDTNAHDWSAQLNLGPLVPTLIGIGYAGTDAIEGLVRKVAPAIQALPGPAPAVPDGNGPKALPPATDIPPAVG